MRGDGTITREAAREGLALLEVDERGLDPMDRKLLLTIIDKFDGGPVGIDTLSAALSEDKETLEDVYEPFLIQEGLLDRTPRGAGGDAPDVRVLRPARAGEAAEWTGRRRTGKTSLKSLKGPLKIEN